MTGEPFSTGQPAKKSGLGCFGWLGVVVVIGIIIWGVTSFTGREDGGSNTSSGNTSTGETTDPIEQARVVLGGTYSYGTVKALTDQALTATGNTPTDDTRSRAWSSVLKVADGLGVEPYAVMECVPGLGEAAAGSLDFPEAAALCANEVAAG